MATDFEHKVRSGEYETKLHFGPTTEAKVAYREDNSQLNCKFYEDAEAYAVASGVPKQYAAKVVSKAWSDGHSSGYSEVLNCLENLIEIFN